MTRLPPRRQGDLGEFSAIEWLGSQGFDLYVPVGHSPDFDMVADDGEKLLRVQVKTSTLFRHGRWKVMVCTRGGNQSWNGTVKRFSAARCDALFVLVADGRRWFIPAQDVEATSALHLGGPKYDRYEVEPGRPLPVGGVEGSLFSTPRRGSRAVKGEAL